MTTRPWSALVLAGGRGSRMDTPEPKPLVEIGGRTLVEHNVLRAWQAGAREVFVAVHHRAAEIVEHCRTNLGAEVPLHFVLEPHPLGTIGALGRLEGAAPVVLTANGDLFSSIDLAALIEAHHTSGADGTVTTHAEHHRLELGEVVSDETGRLTAYREKPLKEFRISSGTNVFGPRIVELVDGTNPIGVPDLIALALERGLDLRVRPHDDPWIDVNDLGDRARARALNDDTQPPR